MSKTTSEESTRFVVQHKWLKGLPHDTSRWVDSDVGSFLFGRERTTFEWRQTAEADRQRALISKYGHSHWSSDPAYGNAENTIEVAKELAILCSGREARAQFRVVRRRIIREQEPLFQVSQG